MKLVSDWRHVWKYTSTQALLVVAALSALWSEIPDEAKAMIPASWQPYVIPTIAILGAVSRVVKQRDADA